MAPERDDKLWRSLRIAKQSWRQSRFCPAHWHRLGNRCQWQEQIRKDNPPPGLWNFLRPIYRKSRSTAAIGKRLHPAAILDSESRVLQSKPDHHPGRHRLSDKRHVLANGLRQESQSAHALHHADRCNSRAPALEIRQLVGHLSEFPRGSSVLFECLSTKLSKRAAASRL